MIRKLLRRMFARAASPSTVPAGPALVPLDIHGIPAKALSPAARHVCAVLQEEGYKAFVVGGAVRDLLAGIHPKDYDVATSATPEQVRSLFRRSRIIGRRFKIVHVLYEYETIEVSTFRTHQGQDIGQTDVHGRILSDNIYGSQEEDASRRDFTVNALYYDPLTEVIVDYHHGVADLQQKTLRMIGDPRTRYREDPVRMLRAVRLAAKLGLIIEPEARQPIREMASLLENVPDARLFDEMLKLLFSGHSIACLEQLREEGLHHGLLPMLDVILEQPAGSRFIWLALENTDARVREDKPVSPGFLFACLLWHEVDQAWKAHCKAGVHAQPALLQAMDEVLEIQSRKLAITRRIVGDIKEIWLLQPRFDRRSGRFAYRLIGLPRYRAAWDFLRLRGRAGEVEMALVDWWEQFAQGTEAERTALLNLKNIGDEDEPRKKRRRRRRKPGPSGSGQPADGSPTSSEAVS
jgi:poly(A) polymerase